MDLNVNINSPYFSHICLDMFPATSKGESLLF